MMKFIGVVFAVSLTLGILAFGAISMVDVPVEQKQVSKTLENERF